MVEDDRGRVLKSITSAVPGVIYQFRLSADGNSSIPYANDRLFDVLGLRPSDVFNSAQPIFDKVHPEDYPGLNQSIINSAKTLEDWEYEFRIIRDNGEVKWLRGLARPEKQPDESSLWNGYILDITDRKLSEQLNYQIRKKFQGYFEAAPDGFFVVNQQGYYIEANPAACRMTGYPLDELLTMHVKQLVHPDFNEDERKTLSRTFSTGSLDEEVLLKKKSGEAFWVRLLTSRVDEHFAIAICYDITARKKQDKFLRNQLLYQRLIADISREFVYTTVETIDKSINKTLEKTGQFFNADRSYVFLFSDDYRYMTNTHEWCSAGIEPQINNLQNFETQNFSWWWQQIESRSLIVIDDLVTDQRLQPNEREVLMSQNILSLLCIPLINEGTLVGFIGLDMVRYKVQWDENQINYLTLIGEILSGALFKLRAENLLRISEKRYRLLAENARDVIYRVAILPKKKFEYISPSIVSLTGYHPEEFYKEANIESSLFFSSPWGNIHNIAEIDALFKQPLVTPLRTKSGDVKWVELSNVPFYNQAGQLEAVEGIARDITSQKEFEGRLKHLNIELTEKKEALEALNESLEKRIQLEVEKNRGLDQIMAFQARQAALGEMIANIAHQWRQPLNVLSLAIYDLAEAFDFDELDKKYLDNTVDEMTNVIQQMSKTIDDFRNFFKPETEKSSFKVSSVVNSALTFMAPYFLNEGVKSGKDVPLNIMVYGYMSQLEQVVINLLKNALDAQQTFLNTEKEIFIKARMEENGFCRIEIFNSGEQIPHENISRLFDPYFTTKPQGQGLGLGLYVARTLVEKNLQGQIVCENVANGVRFIISLPASACI